MAPRFIGEGPTRKYAEKMNLALLFQQQVLQSHNKIAVEDGEHVLSYETLHAKALCLAGRVHSQQLNVCSRVGILIPRGINHVIAQVAVIYAGGSCVPLDPKLPEQQLVARMENLDSTLVIVDTEQSFERSKIGIVRINREELGPHPHKDDSCLPTTVRHNRCCHIFHTSGTTGAPKAVEILADGLINLILDPADLIQAGQRTGHATTVTFDISMLEI
ncbi:hypothetical protein FE257_000614 [Aspergillus nanangensis]|uniref:AMP-dependent synthetase/ligase domain-containing protein n=1 Tax=Aspergillus nanangensis TaxID=2582783 RepID=A0AAD4GPH6_ASPNN|nr:hypothetical protein FE257_000614 [Aspergillus nanangensis]